MSTADQPLMLARGRACPSCAGAMEHVDLARLTFGKVELDVCFDCHAIWFDQYESAQLSPGAVIDLFRKIHEHHDQVARPLADRLRCIQCRTNLVFTQDIQRTNRISYHRCPAGHGRLTTFLQFLREKNFVRDLSKAEIEAIKAEVRQVRCSGCGAPVDVARDAACSHCRSPLAVLDANAVQRTLAELDAKERSRTTPDPKRIAEAMAPSKLAKREPAALRDVSSYESAPTLVDLMIEGIDAIFIP